MTKVKSKIKDDMHEYHEHNHVIAPKETLVSNLGNYKPSIIILIFCILIPFAEIHVLEFQEFMYLFMDIFIAISKPS